MKEYPTTINSKKAPRKECIAFDKLDGSNIRVKWTNKKGFCLFGSRTQLIDSSHPHLGQVVSIFNQNHNDILSGIFEKQFKNHREITVFGEYLGEKSFAGIHEENDPKRFVLFDVLIDSDKPSSKFLLPQDFIKLFDGVVEIPRVVYRGILADSFIQDVRDNKFNLNEGVICKGTERNGAFCGSVWSCKIKTIDYLNKIKEKYGEKGLKDFGE